MHKFRLKNNCITVIHVKMVNMNRKKLILWILRSDFTKTLEIFKRKLTFFLHSCIFICWVKKTSRNRIFYCFAVETLFSERPFYTRVKHVQQLWNDRILKPSLHIDRKPFVCGELKEKEENFYQREKIRYREQKKNKLKCI